MVDFSVWWKMIGSPELEPSSSSCKVLLSIVASDSGADKAGTKHHKPLGLQAIYLDYSVWYARMCRSFGERRASVMSQSRVAAKKGSASKYKQEIDRNEAKAVRPCLSHVCLILSLGTEGTAERPY